jgi:type I restriction enzyme S subunit
MSPLESEKTELRPSPAGWRWVRLGEVCEEKSGTQDPRSEPGKPFQYVDITSVDAVTKKIIAPKTLLGRVAPSRARQVIRTRDVLVATTRPNLNAVALVPQELNDQICSTGFCVLRPRDGLDSAYLFAFVQSTEFIQSLSDLVTGALYPAVTDKQVRMQLISLPPLEEQQRIAAILDEQLTAVEQARAATEAQLDAINALPAALLRRAFSGEL